MFVTVLIFAQIETQNICCELMFLTIVSVKNNNLRVFTPFYICWRALHIHVNYSLRVIIYSYDIYKTWEQK